MRIPLDAAFLIGVAFVVTACGSSAAGLSQVIEARRLASDLHIQFTKAADASNRAVMADTDEASIAAADDAKESRQAVARNVQALTPLLPSLGYADEAAILDRFKSQFETYRQLDDEILALAVENSNVKAQQLSFGAASEAVKNFRASLGAAVKTAASPNAWHAQAIAAQAAAAVLEIEALQAPHIAESHDEAMTRIEAQMAAAESAARKSVEQLTAMLPASAGPRLTEAGAALDKLDSVNDEIVELSRRNTNVRSLALSLGRKSAVTLECDARLRELGDALATHAFVATR